MVFNFYLEKTDLANTGAAGPIPPALYYITRSTTWLYLEKKIPEASLNFCISS